MLRCEVAIVDGVEYISRPEKFEAERTVSDGN